MKPLIQALCAVLLLTAAACNTFEGMGKDVQKAGQALEGGANDARRSMK